MKNRKILLVFFSIVMILLELLPYGAVLTFGQPPEEGGALRETYSYFSLVPVGYANFAPFVIAVLSCVLLCLVFAFVWKGRAITGILVLSLAIVLLSFVPILMGATSAVGIAIAVLALAEVVLSLNIEKSGAA